VNRQPEQTEPIHYAALEYIDRLIFAIKAERCCDPAKLAEFRAAGLPPINDELLDAWHTTHRHDIARCTRRLICR
jgi:hypothetical protein